MTNVKKWVWLAAALQVLWEITCELEGLTKFHSGNSKRNITSGSGSALQGQRSVGICWMCSCLNDEHNAFGQFVHRVHRRRIIQFYCNYVTLPEISGKLWLFLFWIYAVLSSCGSRGGVFLFARLLLWVNNSFHFFYWLSTIWFGSLWSHDQWVKEFGNNTHTLLCFHYFTGHYTDLYSFPAALVLP